MKSCFVKRLSSSSGLWPPTGLFYMSLCGLWRGHFGRTLWMDNFAWWRTKLHYWTYLKIFHLPIIWMRERRICRKRMQAGFHYGHLLDSGLFSSFTYVSLQLEKGRYLTNIKKTRIFLYYTLTDSRYFYQQILWNSKEAPEYHWPENADKLRNQSDGKHSCVPPFQDLHLASRPQLFWDNIYPLDSGNDFRQFR